jgi:hypothetical protein
MMLRLDALRASFAHCAQPGAASSVRDHARARRAQALDHLSLEVRAGTTAIPTEADALALESRSARNLPPVRGRVYLLQAKSCSPSADSSSRIGSEARADQSEPRMGCGAHRAAEGLEHRQERREAEQRSRGERQDQTAEHAP